jgi:hypothetical protein
MFDFIAKMFKLGQYADKRKQTEGGSLETTGMGTYKYDHTCSYINNSIKQRAIEGYMQSSQQCIDAQDDQSGKKPQLSPAMVQWASSSMLPIGDDIANPVPALERLAADSGADSAFQDLSYLISELCQPGQSLASLAHSSEQEVKTLLTECTSLPAEMFELLASGEDLDIKYGVAENYACPLHILARLAEDENPYVAYRASKTLNRLHDSGVQFPERPAPIAFVGQAEEQVDITDIFNQPEAIKVEWQTMSLKETEELSELFDSGPNSIGQTYTNWLLSLAEAANTMSIEQSVSNEVIWLLIEDTNPDVRFALAENYNIDEDMLAALTRDENPYVSHRAQKTLSRLHPAQVLDQDFRAPKGADVRKIG